VRDLNRLDPARAHQIEALARQLVRQESLASSRIEGLSISHRRIGEAAFDPRGSADERAKAVLANIEAMNESVRLGAEVDTVRTETFLELHRTLMLPVSPKLAGAVRDRQNWIGGSWHTPVGAEFVPPPHDEVEPLLGDLAAFMNRDDLPVSFQAAFTHVQFESIHPFADGNGRIGRCLIHVVFRRRGLADHHVPPISLIMASDVANYVRGLTAFRNGREDEWLSYFAATTVEAGHAAGSFADDLFALQERWREAAGVRKGSTAEKVIDLLPVQPVIDIRTASRLAGTSEEAARVALNALAERGVVDQVTGKRWGRVWEANGLWNLLDRFERRLATREGARRRARPLSSPRTAS
jgi:Fic family protein